MITIYRATIEDVNSIKELNQRLFYYSEKFDKTLKLNWPSKNKKYYADSVKDRNSIVLIAKEDKEIIGYLIGSIIIVEDWRKIGKIAELDNMLINEKYRGKGIGTKLIKQFVKWAKSKKIKRAKVVAYTRNTGAIQVYKKLGFAEYDTTLEMQL